MSSISSVHPVLENPQAKNTQALQMVLELLDTGSFIELGAHTEHNSKHFNTERRTVPGDGLITGHGMIDNRPVLVYAHDASFLGGSSGQMHAKKLVKLLDLALTIGIPVIGLNNSSGIRIHEGVDAGATFGEVFHKIVQASGVVPQISLILGDCAGGAAYAPALTDFIIMTETDSTMFLTGPSVIKQATGEEVTKQQIGGASVHAHATGLAHFITESKSDALSLARELLSYLPQNNCEQLYSDTNQDIHQRDTPLVDSILPTDPNLPFDVRDIIREVADEKEFLEVHSLYAPNIVVGYSRIGSYTVGIVANQSSHMAGCLDINASEKAARFVRTCDAFAIPLLTFLDVPGYLPGLEQETGGIISSGAKLLHAYCEASVPKVAVILRKAYGGAYPTLANTSATDLCFALDNSEIAVMGPQGAVDVIFRREIKAASNPTTRREELIHEYREAHASAAYSAKMGYIDSLIEPTELRNTLLSALRLLKDKISKPPARRHSNIQL